MKLKKSLSLALAVSFFAGSFFFTGCGEKKAIEKHTRLVAAMKIGQAEGRENAAGRYAATVKGRYETNMAFQVGGQIASRRVEVGQSVKKGDVLFTIDAKDISQKANSAAANTARLKASYDLAKANYDRYAALVKEGAVSRAAFDSREADYQAALAALDAARAQETETQNALSYTRLVAEADGVITAINAESGQIVGAGQYILTLVQTQELETEIAVPENRRAALEIGQEAEVSFWALGEKKSIGIIREISPLADSAARTYRVRLSLPDIPGGVALGMTASVEFAASASPDGEKNSLEPVHTIPLSALYQRENSPEVWLVVDGKTVRRSIKVIAIGRNDVQVAGLKENETVVIKGIHMLHDGEAVDVKEVSAKELQP